MAFYLSHYRRGLWYVPRVGVRASLVGVPPAPFRPPTAPHHLSDSSDPCFQLRAATLSLSLLPLCHSPVTARFHSTALLLRPLARHGHDRVHRRHTAPEAPRRRALPRLLLCLVSQETPPRRQVRARRLLAPLCMNGCPPDARPVASATSGCRDDERPNSQILMAES
jgi:hypothetical protein